MHKKHLLLLALLCNLSGFVLAQGLYVAPGTTFNILAGTNVSVDSLVITPSATFSLTDNLITKDAVVVHPLANTHILRVYHFSSTTAPFTGSVVFGYADGAELNGLSEAALRLYIHNGAVWTPFLTGYTGDDVNNSLTVSGLAALPLNEVTLASAGVLPLSWLGVQAARKTGNIEVQWQTAAEASIAFFNVERSTDARQWVTVAAGIAPLQTTGVCHYSITDYTNGQGRLYYRVKQTAKTGAYSYSVIVPVTDAIADNDVLSYPNPAKDYFKLGNVARDGLKELQLIDVAGKKVKSWKILQPAYNVAGLPAGIYHLVFIYTNKTIKTSFTKL